ncbi:MAG: DUF4372 domain-containing protein [Hyphomicrobiaceae bacterium]|nr:DUF4372 domain-containing protein [Hyphomicrobiaceae bacterium]
MPRHDFNRLAKAGHCGGALRRMTRWGQLVAMGLGHVARRDSLRDVVATLQAQGAAEGLDPRLRPRLQRARTADVRLPPARARR